MTSRDFCYWLQGLFEIGQPETLSAEQVACVKRHLAMVFVHEIDPSFPAAQQTALSEAHVEKKDDKPRPPKIGGHGPGGTTYRC